VQLIAGIGKLHPAVVMLSPGIYTTIIVIMNSEDGEIVSIQNVSKTFGGITVLNNASLVVKRGEVHALMGENGAGKSTLMKILAGIYQKDKGHIFFKGKEVSFETPYNAIAAGISMIHQELNPLPDLTVAENIFIGREPTFGFPGIVNRRRLNYDTQQLLDEAGLSKRANALMRHLSIAEKQMVEIIKAISLKAEVIIMDEPTSSLSHKEVDRLFSMIAALKSRHIAIIYITHKMDETFSICDTITVLRDGNVITSAPAPSFNQESLITAMVGRKLTEIFPERSHHCQGEVLKINNFSKQGLFSNINLTLHSGEILGISGLAGAGRTELLEAIFGITPPDSGELTLHNKPVKIHSPSDAINHGMAMVTEDRKQKGLFADGSVQHNITLSSLGNYCNRAGVIDGRKEKSAAKTMIGKLGIRASHENNKISTLSGGNQQKVVIARWLLTNPDILLLDEPTRGIDIGAKAEIYKLINSLADEGKAIILVSSEIPELLGLADRVIVMCQGSITAEMNKGECTQEKIMQAAMDFKKIDEPPRKYK
jgi:ABC-type sugar transport system ATPase subunit